MATSYLHHLRQATSMHHKSAIVILLVVLVFTCMGTSNAQAQYQQSIGISRRPYVPDTPLASRAVVHNPDGSIVIRGPGTGGASTVQPPAYYNDANAHKRHYSIHPVLFFLLCFALFAIVAGMLSACIAWCCTGKTCVAGGCCGCCPENDPTESMEKHHRSSHKHNKNRNSSYAAYDYSQYSR